MAWIDPRYEEYQRKRFTGPDRQRFIRPDAYRLAAPGTPEARRPGYRHTWAAVVKAEGAAKVEADEREAFERELLEVRRELDELKFEFAGRRAARLREADALRRKSDLAWDQFFRTFKRYAAQQKAGFNPDQPRDDRGNWTDAGGGDKGPARMRGSRSWSPSRRFSAQQFASGSLHRGRSKRRWPRSRRCQPGTTQTQSPRLGSTQETSCRLRHRRSPELHLAG